MILFEGNGNETYTCIYPEQKIDATKSTQDSTREAYLKIIKGANQTSKKDIYIERKVPFFLNPAKEKFTNYWVKFEDKGGK